MAKSWSEKLQCSVDEDADYGNTYVRLFLKYRLQVSLTAMTSSGATET